MMKKGLSVVVVIVAMFGYHIQECLWSCFVPIFMWYWWLPSSPIECPMIDEAVFRSKLVQVPTIQVKTHEDCLRHGKLMQRPVLCEGVPVDKDAVVEAMLSDTKKYEFRCLGEECNKSIITNCFEVSDLGSENIPAENKTLLADIQNMENCYVGPIIDDSNNAKLKDIFHILDDEVPAFHDNEKMQAKFDNGGSLSFPTSFVGQFKRGDIFTSDHAAVVDSMVYQASGTKIFLMYDHKVTKHWTIYSKILHPWPMCTADYIHNHPAFWIGVVKAGTYMYFPPYWSHIVYSSAGLNVMTNLRSVHKDRVLTQGKIGDVLGNILTAILGAEPWSKNYNLFLRHSYDIFKDAPSTLKIRDILEEYL